MGQAELCAQAFFQACDASVDNAFLLVKGNKALEIQSLHSLPSQPKAGQGAEGHCAGTDPCLFDRAARHCLVLPRWLSFALSQAGLMGMSPCWVSAGSLTLGLKGLWALERSSCQIASTQRPPFWPPLDSQILSSFTYLQSKELIRESQEFPDISF